jgi:iron complex transport system substrate-binding protein
MFSIRNLVAISVLALFAVGCGTDSVDSPTAFPSTSSTTVVPTTLAPATTVPALFPVEVMTDQGPVSIESRPERVVSLSATHTEIIYELAVEEQLVAVDLFSNYPPAAADKARIDSFSFNVEEVAALDPDLVIIAFDFQGETAALATVGIPFLLLGPPVDLDGMYQQFRVIGDALGVPEAGEALATRAEGRARAISADAQSIAGQSFFHEVDDTYYTATSASFIGDVYSSLGLVNIADSALVGGPFPQLSAEFIFDQNPDLIFLGDAAFGASAETVSARPGWDVLSAVSEGHIIEIDADISGRWGPRTVDLMQDILNAVLDVQR